MDTVQGRDRWAVSEECVRSDSRSQMRTQSWRNIGILNKKKEKKIGSGQEFSV